MHKHLHLKPISPNQLRHRSPPPSQNPTLPLPSTQLLLPPPTPLIQTHQHPPRRSLHLHARSRSFILLLPELQQVFHNLWRVQDASHSRFGVIVSNVFHSCVPLAVAGWKGHDGVVEVVEEVDEAFIVVVLVGKN